MQKIAKKHGSYSPKNGARYGSRCIKCFHS